MRNSTPECSVIIPVYNKWELTENCLRSLKEHSAGHNLEVIVVDNGSSDATATALGTLGTALFGDRFVQIVFAENRNFGPACNAGASKAASSLLFFLNNDTLLTPGWYAPLAKALLTNEGLGAVGPLLLYENNTVQHLGVVYGPRNPVHLYRGFRRDHPVVGKRRRLQAITGAAFLVRAEIFHACGGFFEEYRNGFEDIELCCRIYSRGLAMTCVPESLVYHLESQTPGRKADDTYNSDMLNRRCAGLHHIDQHHQLLKDGFSVALSDMLSFSVLLRPEEELSLLQQARKLRREGWVQLVQDNPLWIKGREVLAHILEQEGNRHGAMQMYAELADLEVNLLRILELERFIEPEANAGLWQEVADRKKDVLLLRRDRSATLDFVRQIKKRCAPSGDSFLQKLLDAKVAELFPPGVS